MQRCFCCHGMFASMLLTIALILFKTDTASLMMSFFVLHGILVRSKADDSNPGKGSPLLYNLIVTVGELKSKLQKLETGQTLVENGLENVKDVVSNITRHLRENREISTVAFNTYRTTPKSYTEGNVVVFPRVLLNEGNGYNAHTGYFTAPVTGLYFFSTNTCSLQKKAMVIAIFHMKRQIAATTVYENDNIGCSSVSAPALVQKGEYVFVRSMWRDNLLFADGSHRWPSFNGVLIHPL